MDIQTRLRQAARYTRLDADKELLTEAADALDRRDAQQPATPKPVGFTYQAEIEYADSTGGNGSFWRVPPDLDDESVPLYTHPAQNVPAGYVSVPVQVLRDASEALGNFVSDHGWGDDDMQAMDNLDAYIARHDAKAQKGQP